MKEFIASLLALLMLWTVSAACAENYVQSGGAIPDQTLYQGTMEQTYGQILNNHASAILAYEARTIDYYDGDGFQASYCRPVELMDLTGDGVFELIFMETASGGSRGDLYIYGWNGNDTRCLLYVPGLTRLDYDDFLGFEIYLTSTGGNTLVVEHYEYEWPWVLQFTRNALGQYTLLNYLHIEYDNSAQGNDHYIRNGQYVAWQDYNNTYNSLRDGIYRVVSYYMSWDNTTYGFSYTLQSALNTLGQGGNSENYNNYNPQTFTGIYGYTIDKLATRKGPGTQYDGGGTYSVKNQWINVLAKAWDKRNGIWWVKCEIPYHNEIRVLWTGYKRFDPSTLPLEQLPEEVW